MTKISLKQEILWLIGGIGFTLFLWANDWTEEQYTKLKYADELAFHAIKRKERNPICPECGEASIVLFTPPREGIVGTEEGYKTIGTPEYIDWNRAHLYCNNGSTNCRWEKKIMREKSLPVEPMESYEQ